MSVKGTQATRKKDHTRETGIQIRATTLQVTDRIITHPRPPHAATDDETYCLR